MTQSHNNPEYSTTAKRFHFYNVLLYLLTLILGYLCVWVFIAEEEPRFLFLGLHKSLGIIIFFTGFLWIIWRIINGAPDHSKILKRWEIISSKIAQILLMTSLLVLPLSGVLFQSFDGRPADFFGAINLAIPVAQDKTLADLFLDIHKISAYIITAVLLIHIGAALKHYFIDKDNILQSIWKK